MDILILVIFVLYPLFRQFQVQQVLRMHRGDLVQIHPNTDYYRYKAKKKEKVSDLDILKLLFYAVFMPARKNDKKQIVVLKFDGDQGAKGYNEFARLVDEVVANKERVSEVIVRANSPGGRVSEYGLMFAQMERMRKAGINLTACVDTYAASGGYLMILPALKIVAAPMTMVGSIGVVSEFINAHGFLKRHGFTPFTLTAGEFKRTLTPFGEPTEAGEEHFKEQLRKIHEQFIAAVTRYRSVDVANTCNGDHWTAQQSFDMGLGLVDEIMTSHEYLQIANQEIDLVFIGTKRLHPFQQAVQNVATHVVDYALGKMRASHL